MEQIDCEKMEMIQLIELGWIEGLSSPSIDVLLYSQK